MALQNVLGLVCDPVCGYVQIPCIARNMAGVSGAVAAADAVRLGFNPVIPLDEAFDVLKKTGRILPRELRGCGGGLCWSATARSLMQDRIK
jgi:L-serine dehydratase